MTISLPQPAVNTTQARQLLDQIRVETATTFKEIDLFIDAFLTCLLIRQNMFVLGKPGLAKSAVSRYIANSLVGSKFFATNMSRSQPPSAIFGMMAPSRLIQHDEMVINTTNRAPEADIVLLDEVGRASPVNRDPLLKLMNERLFEQNGVDTPVPLITAIGASNSLLTSEEDQAFMDRMVLRVEVADPVSPDSWDAIIDMGEAVPKTLLPLDALRAMQQEVQQVMWSADMTATLRQLVFKLHEQNIRISPRRARQLKQVLMGYAYLEGDEAVTADHFEFLSQTTWDDPKHRTVITEVINKVAMPSGARVTQILDAARTAVKDLGAAPLKTASTNDKKTWSSAAVNVQAELAQQKIALQQAIASSTNTRKAQQALQDLEKMELSLKQQIAVMFGYGSRQ